MKSKKFFILSGLIFFSLGIFILSLIFYNDQKQVKVLAGKTSFSIKKAEVRDLAAREYASQISQGRVLGAESPIWVTKEGSVKKSRFEFIALAPAWQADPKESSDLQIEIRTSRDGENWSDWQVVQEDEDGDEKDGTAKNKKYGSLVFAEGSYFQERTTFQVKDLSNVPSLENLEVNYLDSREKLNPLERILRKVKGGIREVFAANAVPTSPIERPYICSRACWGADESIYVPGEGYEPIKKMIVHHTVTPNNDPNPKATIRLIYYFHNVVRGWGDIGYNFLVDQRGNIYEGRYGGEDVIGMHARGYNTGSVGVSVLGDFREFSPNKRVQNALQKVAVWKLYSKGVDPQKYTTFGNPPKPLPGITTHGIVALTACAGTRLNNFVPTLRARARYMPQQIVLRNSNGVQTIIGSIDKTVGDLLSQYSSQGSVSPNYVRKIQAFPTDGTTPPDDTNYSSQWELTKLGALDVWRESEGGDPSVKVAIIDTGVAFEDYDPDGGGPIEFQKAPDFEDTTFVSGYDFANEDSHPNDDHGHGTVVTSLIAASTDNNQGVASLAYKVSIMPIKVCNNLGSCTDADVAQGIEYARENGAKVINISLGGSYYSQVIQDEINAAAKSGAVIVAAAGNGGTSTVSYPGRGANVIGVGALTNSDTKSSYSNWGTNLDLVAPGGSGGGGVNDILAQYLTCTDDFDCTSFSYVRVAGTSISAPVVSASAALLVSNGFEGGGNIESILRSTADDLGTTGYDKTFGFGRVAPFDALQFPDFGGVILDGFGGVHNFGDAESFTFSKYWKGWDIARAVAILPDGTGGVVLDGWGGLHHFGSITSVSGGPYWKGWDIARDVVFHPTATSSDPKGYILDGWGGIHEFGGAPNLNASKYWKGKDIANALVIKSDGLGGYVLDAYGGINKFGNATTLTSPVSWKGWDIARDVVLRPNGTSGYLLDGYGGIHRFGGAPTVSIGSYWKGWDIARSISINNSGTGGYVLDGYGGIHSFGDAPIFPKSNYAYWKGLDIGNAVVLK